jgi:Sulfotransferase family
MTGSTLSKPKTFVLGVGAQKAGTTWLHAYLNSYACSDFGMHKEYHIWDAVYSELCAEFKVTPEMLVEPAGTELMASNPNALRYAMQNFPGVYEGYFSSLIASDSKWITGDITPAYASLTRDALLQVKQRIESAGMAVKVVFLMRDPFERCWSAVRMYKRTAALAGSDEDCLEQNYRSDQFNFRSSYHKTIQALESVFPPDAIFYGFYENLFTEATLDRLSRFLGIPAHYAVIDQSLNASPKSEPCRSDLRQEVMHYYADVYAFCQKRFPEVRELWGQ